MNSRLYIHLYSFEFNKWTGDIILSLIKWLQAGILFPKLYHIHRLSKVDYTILSPPALFPSAFILVGGANHSVLKTMHNLFLFISSHYIRSFPWTMLITTLQSSMVMNCSKKTFHLFWDIFLKEWCWCISFFFYFQLWGLYFLKFNKKIMTVTHHHYV